MILCDREDIELNASSILNHAIDKNVAFLVVGDPFGYLHNILRATTHSDLFLRACKQKVKTSVIHNASIMNAIGECGLQLYNFGMTVSIPFFTEKWRPDSFYDKIAENDSRNLHTLCLLDIKMKEQSEENLFQGKLIYEPPRFMTVCQALAQLQEVEARMNTGLVDPERTIVVIARLGSNDQVIIVCSIKEALNNDFGAPLHSLIIPSRKLHEIELEALKYYRSQ